jgi:predicted Rossmann fold flavoprotein
MHRYDIIVVGAGPAGFFAALAAAEELPELKILILEKNRYPLGKVSISGGGRCNITHACYDPAQLVTYYPRGGKELRSPFTRFQPRDTVAWFEGRQVMCKTEHDGRIFPTTDRSETIIKCLMREADKSGVELRTSSEVKSISLTKTGFSLSVSKIGVLNSHKVLLATGGGSQSSYNLASCLGHSIIPPVPSLFTFNIQDPRLESLAGITLPVVEVSLLSSNSKNNKPIKVMGALLITHWGLSGPAVLSLSSWGARTLAEASYSAQIRINWLPSHNREDILKKLKIAREAHFRRKISKQPPVKLLPIRLWRNLVYAAGINLEYSWSEISNHSLRRLSDQLTRSKFHIQGKGINKDEFVTCGGVSLKEVNFKTLESRLCPGLYFAGEILDIDGLTGGFNFQSAWTTGWLAGKSMAEK